MPTRLLVAVVLGTTLALPAFAQTQTDPKEAKPAATAPAAKPVKPAATDSKAVNSKAAKPTATSPQNAPADTKEAAGCQHGKDADA